MNKELIDKFKTITKKIENPIIKNLLIEMIDTIEEQREKITNLEQEKQEMKNGWQQEVYNKDEILNRWYETQGRIDKAIEYIKSYNLPDDLGKLSEAPISVSELKELLNILTGGDSDE